MKRRTLLTTVPMFFVPRYAGAQNPVPQIQELNSPKGTPFLLVQSNTQDKVALAFTFEGGDVDDGLAGPQVARLSATLLLEGSNGKSDDELIESFRDFGGQLSAEPGADRFSFRLVAPSAGFSGALGVLNEVLRQPDFPEARILRRREEAAREAESASLYPGSKLARAFASAVAEQHPYSNIIAPDPERLRAITRPDLLAWKDRTLTQQGFRATLVGNLTAAEAGQSIDQLLEGLPDTSSRPPKPPVILRARTEETIRIAGDSGDQVELLIGDLYQRNTSLPQLIEHSILAAIFGQGQKSRIYNVTRSKLGSTYGLSLNRSEYDGINAMTITGRVDRAKADETIAAIRQTWQDYRSAGPKPDEVADSRAAWLGYLQQTMFEHEQLASLIQSWAILSGSAPKPLELLESFNSQKIGTRDGLESLFSANPLAVIAG